MLEVPPELLDKSHLTRLDLMCNTIEVRRLPPPSGCTHAGAPIHWPRAAASAHGSILCVCVLQALPPGPYLASVRCAHLGNNCFAAFPSALLAATQVGGYRAARTRRWAPCCGTP